ncbi:MAG: hypothetical protein QOD30_1118, partial [Actinomycetota bacterium]|nr:hypothetical protein [Actinomycetota bacterium]
LASLELDLRGSLELAHEGVRVAESDLSATAHRYQPLLFLGMSQHDLDELDDTMRTIDDGRRTAEQGGMTFAAPLFHAFAAFTNLRAGRVDQAAAEAEAGVAMCEETSSAISLAMNHAVVALASLHLDDLETMRTAVAAGERAVAMQPPWLGLDLIALAAALLNEADGDLEAAYSSVEPTWALFEALGARTMSIVVGPTVARLALAIGRHDEAAAVATALEEIAERMPLPSWRAAALETRGLVDGDTEVLVAAVELHRASPRILPRAGACERAAAALLACERTEDAVALLDEAIELYTQADARRDRARATASLRAAGGRVRRQLAADDDEWGTLSRAERDVARLVALGLSNPEIAARLFISRRTVETHLRRIFAKLDIASRVELAVWVQSHLA